MSEGFKVWSLEKKGDSRSMKSNSEKKNTLLRNLICSIFLSVSLYSQILISNAMHDLYIFCVCVWLLPLESLILLFVT